MIALKSSGDHDWPWTSDAANAEEIFRKTYPGIFAALKPREAELRARQDKGQNWWELRSCAYWDRFDSPKTFFVTGRKATLESRTA